ncbi:MAG: family 10 glycosylhydrolase [Bacilli bacterium]|nr:family 10 glycosylhydrolase [Bacilli bacterium]
MTKRLSIVTMILLMLYIMIPTVEEGKQERTIQKEIRGVFISYIELQTYIKNKTYNESINNIENIVKNLKQNNFNTIYLQVRSHMDSIYDSDLFPVSKNIILKNNESYDVLEKFIEISKKENISIYAWVNPYRIGNNYNKESRYYSMVKDDIKNVNGVYYLNPASNNTTNLIVDGIKEIVKKYEVKGILFDDYFYPSKDIDIEEYNSENKSITIEEYRLNNINKMVKKVNKEIKNINKNIEFGISPDANIDNDYNKEYADVKRWGEESEYVDFLMPQIYYGFENETKPFEVVLEEWKNIVKNRNVKLLVALAFYKTGKIDNYAKKGENEWINNNDIIKREVLMIREKQNINGFSMFRYDNMFNENIMTDNSKKEIQNLKEIM